jgi:outer membrane protein OmpU
MPGLVASGGCVRKLLLGTTAICAIGAAAPALAQTSGDPIKLQLGGYLRSAYGDIASESGANGKNRSRDGIKQDNVIRFDGATKLDNGLTVGASVQMRALNTNTNQGNSPNNATGTAGGTDQIKRVYALIRGTFGELRIGDDDSARRQLALAAPEAGNLFGTNSPVISFSNNPVGTNSTMLPLEGNRRTSKLLYFTPTMGGFSFAVSYSPTGTKGNLNIDSTAPGNTSQTTGLPGTTTRTMDDLALAANFDGRVGPFDLEAYLAGEHNTRETTIGSTIGRNNPMALGGGMVLGWGPFKFGGAYDYVLDPTSPMAVGAGRRRNQVFDIGMMVTEGPYALSLAWSRGIYTNLVDGTAPVLHEVVLSGNYALGPGIALGAALEYSHYNSHSALSSPPSAQNFTANYSGLSLMAGTDLTF